MRRQDIQLLARARQGNIAARCEAGRRYLLGLEGFPKHIASGIDYLSHPDVKGLPQAAQIIAETLPLQDIIALHQQTALEAAAAAGVCAARAKLGAWLTMTGLHSGDGMRWLELAATQGHSSAAEAVAADAQLEDRSTGPAESLQQVRRPRRQNGRDAGRPTRTDRS